MKEILREIGMIYRCLNSISNIEFKSFDLEKGQYAYLVRICENPGIIQERVAEMLRVDRATASRAIQKLEGAGFIEKKNDADNKRVLLLYPTQKGEEIFRVLASEEFYTDGTALAGISEQEQQQLLVLLKRIRENLDPEWALVKSGGKRVYLKEFE